MGKEQTIMVVKGLDIATFKKTRYLSRDFMVNMLIGRPEFVGEEDELYLRADELLNVLVCK